MGQFLDPPVLNITPIYLGRQSDFPIEGVSDYLAPPNLFDPHKKMWALSNQTVDSNYLQNNGICQAEKVSSVTQFNA